MCEVGAILAMPHIALVPGVLYQVLDLCLLCGAYRVQWALANFVTQKLL
jgi:hypothetical protein